VRKRAGVAVAALLSTMVVAPPAIATAQEPGPVDCPTIRPVSGVAAGDVGVGYTVARGVEPEPFDVEVVDVLTDALAPGVPLIVVETESPELDRVGGIWAGMSGSPVYVEGELIGAVGYGFSLGPSKLGGVTPATAMQQVASRPTLPPPPGAAPRSVPMNAEVRSLATREHGVTAGAARAMAPLEVPVRLSGPGGAKFERAADAFESAYPGTRVVRSGAAGTATAAATDIVAGGNLAVSLAYGDHSAVGVGTTTFVCDGVATGFGHPLLYDGATRLGLHGASTVRVVDDATLGPYKLANPTAPVGTIDQDRLAGVAGRVGPLPLTTAITSRLTVAEGPGTVTGRTDAVLPDALFGAVLNHGWINYDLKALDDLLAAGTSTVSWRIDGIRRDGSPFTVRRRDRHASLEDLSTEALIDVAAAAQELQDNPFETIRVTDVDYEADVTSTYAAYRIVDAMTVSVDGSPPVSAASGVELAPGSEVTLGVPLRRYRAGTRTVDVTLRVPDGTSGFGSIEVSGGTGGFEDPLECLYAPEFCRGPAAEDLDGLLASIASRPRNDQLVATLRLGDDGDGDGGDEGSDVVVSSTVDLDDVVTGATAIPAAVGDGAWWGEVCADGLELPFLDVDPAGVHADNIACAADLGIASGVSEDPPLYAPGRSVTRGQAASFLARMLDVTAEPLPAAGRARFRDTAGSVHADNIERLAAAGIVRGRTATTFDPQATVTRAQVATLLVGTLGWVRGEDLRAVDGPYFDDVAGVHAGNIDTATELGLMFGRDDGTFGPGRATRRDQMASVLVRTLEAVVVG
jgi:hypothetical protein